MIVTRWPRVLQPSLHHKIQFEDNKNIIDDQWELGNPTLIEKMNNLVCRLLRQNYIKQLSTMLIWPFLGLFGGDYKWHTSGSSIFALP